MLRRLSRAEICARQLFPNLATLVESGFLLDTSSGVSRGEGPSFVSLRVDTVGFRLIFFKMHAQTNEFQAKIAGEFQADFVRDRLPSSSCIGGSLRML